MTLVKPIVPSNLSLLIGCESLDKLVTAAASTETAKAISKDLEDSKSDGRKAVRKAQEELLKRIESCGDTDVRNRLRMRHLAFLLLESLCHIRCNDSKSAEVSLKTAIACVEKFPDAFPNTVALESVGLVAMLHWQLTQKLSRYRPTCL